ncbi:hypothetical protein Vafri_11819 [Volvox africanus]|uniref:EF-hand domain-containing protein n=1 Tax=Volvox africanus TaxID=51714 RepID=A0A8J4F1S1_9CHLO|nr:hypothetical protein Vafri_11819 [Volvox africanus]
MLAPLQVPTGTSPLQPRSRRQRSRRSNNILQASIIICSLRKSSYRSVDFQRQPCTYQPGHPRTSTVKSGIRQFHSRRADAVGRTSLRSYNADPPRNTSESVVAATVSAVVQEAGESVPSSPSSSPSTSTSPAADAAPADSEAARRGLASMAQLASAWAQVSSRLTPGALVTPDSAGPLAVTSKHRECKDSAAQGAVPTGAIVAVSGTRDGGASGQEEGSTGDGGGRAGGGEVTGDSALSRAGIPDNVELLSRSGTWPILSAPSQQLHAGAHGEPHVPLRQLQPQPPQLEQMQQQFTDPGDHPIYGQRMQQQHQREQGSGQRKQQQHQRPHFEAIITALKLALASLQNAPPRRDGRTPATRAVQLASTLADLCAAGLPLDAAAMCAGVVAEAADLGALGSEVIRAQLGSDVAALVHDMLRVREAPRRIELLDDEGASAMREWCLALHDVRACVVEVVSWWDELQHLGGLPEFEQQALALESLQIGAPLGHALGLGALSAVMEDMCLKVLFPESYASTCAWLRGLLDPAEDALFVAQQRLLAALDADPDFGRLAGGLVVKARTKSLFSVMKKLLHLGDMARGGRSREELYDLLGMRAVVKPPDFLPPDEAEAAATKACYIVQDVACKLWRPISSRSKDYIVAPKPNGYQSIHLTLQLGQLDMSYDTYGTSYGGFSERSSSSDSSAISSAPPSLSSSTFPAQPPSAALTSCSPSSSSSTSSCEWDQLPYISTHTTPEGLGTSGRTVSGVSTGPGAATTAAVAAESAAAAAASGPLCLELQIRTAAMDLAAERGDAAHAVYKGGLDAGSARQLQAWTQELQRRLAEQPKGRLLLRAAAATASTTGAEAAVAAERRRRRRERRAAAAEAAAALAAATPLPLSQTTALVTNSSTSVVTPVDSSVVSLLHPASDSATFNKQDTSAVSESAGPMQAPAVAAARGAKSDGSATARLMPPPTRRKAATSASAGNTRQGVNGAPTSRLSPAATHVNAPASATATVAATDVISATVKPRATNISGRDAAVVSPSYHPPSTSVAMHLNPNLDPERHRQSLDPQSSHEAAPDATTRPSASTVGGPGRAGRSEPAVPQDSAATVNVPSTPPSQFFLNQLPSLPPQQSFGSRDATGMQTSHFHEAPQDLHQQTELQQQQPLTEQQRLMLFSSLGSIDEVEEAPLVIGLGQRDAAAAAEQLFLHLDVNGDGRLSLGEVRQALMDLGAPASERDAVALLAALDRNGDGGVSMEEFVDGLGQAQQDQQPQKVQQSPHERDTLGNPTGEMSSSSSSVPRPQPARQLPKPSWQPWQRPA